MNKFPPLSARVNRLLHGADYNPEQWAHQPGIIDDDVMMMKQANCNVMSVGIFSWAKLEPEEGRYEFGWLDEVIDTLWLQGYPCFLLHQAGPGQPGCRRRIRRCCVWGAIACRLCMVVVITTA